MHGFYDAYMNGVIDMSGDPTINSMPLEDFVARTDTIALLSRDGFISSEDFRRRHGIRVGPRLTAGYYVNYVDRGRTEGILAEVGENALTMLPVVLGLLDQQSLEAAGIIQVQQQPYLNLTGRNTILGFIDTGIDYTQDIFRYEDGTSKIKYIWDQSIPGNAPDGYYLGTEYSEEQINQALQAENPYDIVPHRDTVGHGTFLASVAAGRRSDNFIGAAPDAEIIAVKLQKAKPYFYEQFFVPDQQENVYTSSDLMQGIQYIKDKAARMGRPVSLCIALGTNLGGHDGFGMLEEYLTAVSNNTGVAVSCAAGNESQAGHHAEGKLSGVGDAQRVELLVNNEQEDILLHLWNGATDRMSVSFTSPTGEQVPSFPVRSGSSYTSRLILEQASITVQYFLPVRGSGDQMTSIRILNPTPGLWTLTINGEIVLDGTYHLWLPMTGFLDPGTVFLTPSPNTTIVTPATAVGVTACGAYDSRSNALYIDSSWGKTRRPTIAPHFVAPGVRVGGYFPTGYGQMSGTSASAAITAGACALLQQWGIVDGNEPALTSIRIRTLLLRGCERDPAMVYPNAQWGYGKLDVFDTLNIMRS